MLWIWSRPVLIRTGKSNVNHDEEDIFHRSQPNPRPQPRVTDFKSGAKAAGSRLWNGWRDGITGIVTQPRAGYERHGALGGAAGGLVGTVNMAVKPSVGTLSSLTWLGRGTYASVKKAVDTYRNEGRRISTKLSHAASGRHVQDDDVDDQGDVSAPVKRAAAVSGFHPRVCQQIIDEFDKIKAEQEHQVMSSSKQKRLLAAST